MHRLFLRRLCLPLFVTMLVAPIAATRAQETSLADGFDPSALMSGSQDLLGRAPDSAIDQLFQAVHSAGQNPDSATALCGLFDQHADHSIDGLNALAGRLDDDTRQRFANAIAAVLIGGLQGTPQVFDQAAAEQALKANGARAAMLHDGFVAGLNADGDDAASRDARCRSLRWMLDVLATRPASERAQVTRLLLNQGLQRLAPAAAAAGR